MPKLYSGVPESPYWLRYLMFAARTKARQSVFDYKYFPHVVYPKRQQSIDFADSADEMHGIKVRLGNEDVLLDNLVRNSGTYSFLVLKGGKLVYQYFADGIDATMPLQAYSVTKSFFSSYLSKLIEAGALSLDKPLDEFGVSVPHVAANRTIRSLINMESGIGYSHGHGIGTDMAHFWLTPNLRKMVSRIRTDVEHSNPRIFLYNDIHLHLLSYLIDCKLSDIITDFNCTFLRRFAPNADVLLCLDSSAKRMPKFDGGMAASPIDFLRLGRLYLNNGVLDSRQVIPSAWCKAVKSSSGVRRDLPYWSHYKTMGHWWYPALSKGNTYYKFMWWGREQQRTFNDIYAMGVLGQFVYVSTENDVVIVRQGNRWGMNGWWPDVFEDLANRI